MTNTTNESELEVLESTLTKIFVIISSEISNAKLVFRPLNIEDLENRPREAKDKIVSMADIIVPDSGRSPLWIEQNERGNFRVCFHAEKRMGQANRFHALLVPKEFAAQIDEWQYDPKLIEEQRKDPMQMNISIVREPLWRRVCGSPEETRNMIISFFFDSVEDHARQNVLEKADVYFKQAVKPLEKKASIPKDQYKK